MLTLTLDGQDVSATPRYRSDDPIALTVEAELYESCIALVAQLRWDAIGEHDPAHEAVEEVVLARDLPAMTTSQTFTHTFAAPGDGHPPSYDGETFQYVWRVVVIANQRGGEEREERVVHMDTRSSTDHDTAPGMRPHDGGRYELLLGSVGAAIGALVLFGALQRGSWTGIAGASACMLLIPLPLLLAGLRLHLASRLIQGAAMTLTGHPGEDARCTLRFTPRWRLHTQRITATLLAEERWTREVGEGRSPTHEAHAHALFTQTVTLASDGALPGGEEARFDGVFSIPADAPPTIDLSMLAPRVVWTLRVHIDLPWWPDWTHQTPVQLHHAPSRRDVKEL